MTQLTQKKLTKKERKAQRAEDLAFRGIASPTNTPKAKKPSKKGASPAGWNELIDIHKHLVKALENLNGLKEYIEDPVIVAHMDRELFLIDWKIAEHDIKHHFNPKLLELHERTQALRAQSENVEDVIGEFTELFFDYHALAEQMEAVMSPTQYALMDNVNQAVNQIRLKVRQEQEEKEVLKENQSPKEVFEVVDND